MSAANDDHLDAALALIAAKGPDAGSVWRHRKGGVYEVVCCAVRETDLVPVVVYRDERPQGATLDRKTAHWFKPTVCWTRPLAEFTDGRFVLVRGAGQEAGV